MKHYLLIAASFLLLASCAAPRTVITGADRDAHGCIRSAGYQWSAVRGECVRVWQAATLKLTSVKDSNKAAFVIFATDKKKAEIFADKFPDGLIVKRLNEDTFTNSSKKITLFKSANGWQITQGKKIVYTLRLREECFAKPMRTQRTRCATR